MGNEEPLTENDEEEEHTREPSEAEKDSEEASEDKALSSEDMAEEQPSEEPDEDKESTFEYPIPVQDELSLYIKDWAEVPPFPDSMPAPMALMRGQDGVLVMTGSSGNIPHFTMDPWMLETLL
jgi:hypothetical protein